jgi:diadenosine tetraphosphate (Ap4A) HIT family hydrolase
MTVFELDPVLAGDTVDLGSLGLCRVLLMNDARYPWLILAPAKSGLVEIANLDRDDRIRLMDEITAAGNALAGLYDPEKINTGALGNIVRQLHIHVVARSPGDPAWPGPVWGHSPALPYAAEALEARISELRGALNTGTA